MKRYVGLILFTLFSLASCNKNVAVDESEYVRAEAFKSREFRDLKIAYNEYRDYGKTKFDEIIKFTKTDMERYRIERQKYKIQLEKLSEAMKSKSIIFYDKYPNADLKLTFDEFEGLAKN